MEICCMSHSLYIFQQPSCTSLATMPAPTEPHWIRTRFQNVTAHPGAVNISMEETAGNLPKTLAPRKQKPRGKKDMKSAEEVEAGIQHVAAYEKWSLHEELVDATPQVVYTPAYPQDVSDPLESSGCEEGSNISDNASYKPPSISVGDVLMSEAEVGSLPSPVGKMADQGNKGKGKKGKGKVGQQGGSKGTNPVVLAQEDSATKSDDKEPTPFKRPMSEQGRRFGKELSDDVVEESTPIKVVVKGAKIVRIPVPVENSATESDKPIVALNTGKAKAAPAAAEDSATESNEPIAMQKTGTAKAAPAMSIHIQKASANVGPAAGSNNESCQPNSALSRPKARPWKQSEAPAALSAPQKVASKLVTKPRLLNEMPDKPEAKLSKPKVTKGKGELAMAKDTLKRAQEEVKKAQEAQKKVREEAERLKESTRELGVGDHIKAVNNNGESVDDQALHPPHLSRLTNNGKSRTHHNGDAIPSKSKPKANAKGYENPFEGIYDFGLDNAGNAAPQPNTKPQSPPRDNLFDFSLYDSGLQVDFEDNNMDIDVAEPSAYGVDSGKLKTTKKVVASGSGLAKSGSAGGNKTVKASEKGGEEVVKLMVKGKAEKGIQEQGSQASHLNGLIADRFLTPGLVIFDQMSTNTGKKHPSTTREIPKLHGTR